MTSRFVVAFTCRLWMMSLAVTFGLALTACSGGACPPKGFESAADYNGNHLGGYTLRTNRWTRNPRLEAFLLDALQSEGFASLTAKYGMQCSPRSSVADCHDCYVCNKAYPSKSVGMFAVLPFGFAPGWKCVDFGEMFVRADVGPGSAVIAMTYLDQPTRPLEERRPGSDTRE